MKNFGEISFNRKHLFLVGFTVIILIALTNRLDFIFKSNFAEGMVVGIKNLPANGKNDEANTIPIVRFIANSDTIYFYALKNSHYYYGDTVKVVYHKSQPTNARIFGFEDFIYPILLYCILPIMILGASVFSFIRRNDKLTINFKNFFYTTKKNKGNNDAEH